MIESNLNDRFKQKKCWLVTGCAGFIGSHIVEALLNLDQQVVGIDNFSTGKPENITSIQKNVVAKWSQFKFIEGDINDLKLLNSAMNNIEVVLHQAALGSVPRSMEDPIATNTANVSGFLNLLWSAKQSGVKRVVYASSSSVYGDDTNLPKVESKIGLPLSPYAASKLIDEIYADIFNRQYGLSCIGLRYFNVFGPRQDPSGAYAAVIPKWIDTLTSGGHALLYGDGSTSRDFCYVENVVNANLLAASAAVSNGVYNIGAGGKTTLNELYQLISDSVSKITGKKLPQPEYQPFRAGDVMHSQADTRKAQSEIGYNPSIKIAAGIEKTVVWFLGRQSS